MTRLPQISGREVVKALNKVGYERAHQRGSHIVLRQPNYPYRRVVIPDHIEIVKGTPRAIIRQVGLTVEEFITLI